MAIALGYLRVEFAIGLRINTLAWGGLPLLPLAAQAVILLPRLLAAAMCGLVIAGVSGMLTWIPDWPHWLSNIAQATAAVVFVCVYVGVAQREREARGGRPNCSPARWRSSPPPSNATGWRARSTTRSVTT